MRRFAVIAATICLLAVAAFYFYLTGRIDLLHRRPHWTVEVNGAAIDGEVLAGRVSAVVTRRDKGKEHSYLLFYAGDVDQTGDIGQVIDCQNWIAPNLPILIETGGYPKCKVQPKDNASSWRMSLTTKDASEQFVTTDRNVISIIRR
jgi:hypothetical protein